ncbi:MAG: site-specific DNA-methyltransferase [Prevotellaceae bacterium]|jgi:DNA modification methylase|nr:site-specific DNA-methyltransferase [Prevotellaceae bacterium]
MSVNKLILGDNLEILKTIESETIDLIYLDPPFFSNRNYEVIWGDEGEIRSFQDRWAGGIDHYITWLKERVEQMHRILKPTGSIFLHCDWHADAYIRVEILDKIFGYENFRNLIIWKRKNSIGQSNKKSRQFGYNIDSIYFYSKTKNNTFNTIFMESNSEYIEKFFTNKDPDGRIYRLATLTSPSPRPNLTYEYKGHKPPEKGWAISYEKMIEWDKKGKIFIPDDTNKRIQRKIYLDEIQGQLIQTLWDDINVLSPSSKERIGYPTQKPEALLERIIKCASNEGDTVLDPFVGGGTTVAVADKLNRKWIGIDQSVQAIKVTELRLDKQRDLFSAPFSVQLHKYDYDTLRNKNAFEFEAWIVQQFGGASNTRQRNDLGLDGKMPDNTPIQVKRSDNIGRNVIDNFLAAVMRNDQKLFDKNVADKKPVGYIIAFSFGRGAVEEVARLKLKNNIIIELVKVEDIVPIAKKPTVSVEINELARDAKGVREIEFVASGTSEAGIEFYSWDFAYDAEHGFKADVMLDKEGKQTTKLKAGLHNIAVKVVDNDGLESIEVIKLKVNGTVERS